MLLSIRENVQYCVRKKFCFWVHAIYWAAKWSPIVLVLMSELVPTPNDFEKEKGDTQNLSPHNFRVQTIEWLPANEQPMVQRTNYGHKRKYDELVAILRCHTLSTPNLNTLISPQYSHYFLSRWRKCLCGPYGCTNKSWRNCTFRL